MPRTATRWSRFVDLIVGGTRIRPEAVKVPLQITALFWAIKIISTAMGEALADWLDGDPDLVVAALGGLLALVGLIVALRLQFRTTRYTASVYWFAVAMVATFGTMAADALHQFLALPYWATTAGYAAVLVAVFYRWRAVEGTLSIHSIDTRSRETFYWATVLATFALGTAAGDWTAGDLGLKYLPSGLLFAAIILVPAAGRMLGANPVAMFWFAYVITRPLGASFADWADSAPHRDGLGIAHAWVWGSLAVVMAGLVAVSVTIDRRRDRASVPSLQPLGAPTIS